ETYVPAQAWWDALGRQYRGEGVEFEARKLPQDARVPRSLFDSVADNLIRNALAKRATRVHVSLDWDSSIALRVRDSGSAVPRRWAPAGERRISGRRSGWRARPRRSRPWWWRSCRSKR